MRNAQRAALMAIFAALEENGEDDERRETRPFEPVEAKAERLIQVDLAALSQARSKTSA